MRYALLTLLPSALFMTKAVFSADAELSLGVAGTIFAPPSWNSPGQSITSVDFDYSTFVPGVAASNVDSSPFSLTLSDPAQSGNVRFAQVVTPSGCSIGSTSISDNHVKLVRSTLELPDNAYMPLHEGTEYNIFLRFVDEGNYGDSSGSVNCSVAGNLTYSY